MLRSATVVLAIVVSLGSSGLSTSAFARGHGYGSVGGGDGFRGNHLGGGCGGTPSYGGRGNRASGLRSVDTGAAISGATGPAYYVLMLKVISLGQTIR
jgi:hypothetical protein